MNQLVNNLPLILVFLMSQTIATVFIHVAEGYQPLILKIYQNSNFLEQINKMAVKLQLTNQIYNFIVTQVGNQLKKNGLAPFLKSSSKGSKNSQTFQNENFINGIDFVQNQNLILEQVKQLDQEKCILYSPIQKLCQQTTNKFLTIPKCQLNTIPLNIMKINKNQSPKINQQFPSKPLLGKQHIYFDKLCRNQQKKRSFAKMQNSKIFQYRRFGLSKSAHKQNKNNNRKSKQIINK